MDMQDIPDNDPQETQEWLDALEAVIGALYLDGGLSTAMQFVLSALEPELALLEGGVIGYDTNTVTGGAGASFLGINRNKRSVAVARYGLNYAQEGPSTSLRESQAMHHRG